MANQVPESQYHAYFKKYIKLVEDIPLNKALMSGMFKVAGFYESLSEENWSRRYADGKWTLKEILLHTIDTERIFCSRALQIARSENSILSGFDENLFADNSFANER
ncbi:MAG TPA: damage-inducible protein DinB, partial [Flavobacteriaceae bacterium]|nr:damage-inducible protein DinB [Flavobacteriaceae bacterium]